MVSSKVVRHQTSLKAASRPVGMGAVIRSTADVAQASSPSAAKQLDKTFQDLNTVDNLLTHPNERNAFAY
jgi:hypothetical protein